MTIGAALVLIAVGAILRFAITTVSTHGFNLHTIGDILMIVGAIGLALWLLIWAPRRRGPRVGDRPRSPDPDQRTDEYRTVPHREDTRHDDF